MNQVTMICLVIDLLVCLASAHGIYGLRRLAGSIWPRYRNAVASVTILGSMTIIYGSNVVITSLG